MQAKLAWVENDKEDAFLEQMLTTANGCPKSLRLFGSPIFCIWVYFRQWWQPMSVILLISFVCHAHKDHYIIWLLIHTTNFVLKVCRKHYRWITTRQIFNLHWLWIFFNIPRKMTQIMKKYMYNKDVDIVWIKPTRRWYRQEEISVFIKQSVINSKIH
jgi:hypothetical protein